MFGFLTLGTTLTFMDQAFKAKIEEQKDESFPRELEGSKGKIKLYKNHNKGFSLGLFKGTKGRILEKLAVTLTLAGGISNLYDRMKRGYVVVYFSFEWKFLKKLVFNLGDMFIFLGSGMMLIASLIDALKDVRRKK